MDEMRVVLSAPGRPYDLLIVCTLTGVAVLLSVLGIISALTSLLAFVCVFFTPGYALVSAMFPGRSASLGKFLKGDESQESEMSLLERGIASVVLSLLVFAIGGIILAWTPGGLNKSTVLAEVLVLNIAVSAVAIMRRFKLDKGDEFVLAFELGGSKGGKLNLAEKIVLGAVVVVLVVAVLAGAGVLWPGIGLEPHTEFYITGADGSLGTLPQSLAVNANGTVLVTFVNHMGGPIDYNLTVGVMENGTFDEFEPLDWTEVLPFPPGIAYYHEVSLLDDGRFSQAMTFRFTNEGEYQVMFLLSDGDEVQDLWLWVTVT
ncbi:MAG: DUF1616 domain-containing protein [Methanomassiliicoccales archaeon]|nr:DUF1616 domain-containing protein [Methanomassiliicoccales archaeon]